MPSCGCLRLCGDDGGIDGPGTCKGLPRPKTPLVEIVLVPKRGVSNKATGKESH